MSGTNAGRGGNAAGVGPVGEGEATPMDGVDVVARDEGGEAHLLQHVRACGEEGQDSAALLANADAQCSAWRRRH